MTDNQYRSHIVTVDIPEGCNVIFGHAHFIKTVEDLYETLVTSTPSLLFGIGFCEASQKRLVRSDGNDEECIRLAEKAAFDVAAGHSFFIYMKNGFPINVLNRVKQVDEVARIYCATANPLQVLIAETSQGRGVMGVIDGEAPLGIETDDDKAERRQFLRTIGYKR
ncbi:adenosine monophosphate-protein transferase [candidate division GN15 bacterium]|nr:adenosine monophosphate-protein transferase [candidate division GN15 bacterium]